MKLEYFCVTTEFYFSSMNNSSPPNEFENICKSEPVPPTPQEGTVEDEPPKQPINSYLNTSDLKAAVLQHADYPQLPFDVRITVEGEGRFKLCHLTYHEFLVVTSIYLATGINYPFEDGTWLFPTKEIPTAE